MKRIIVDAWEILRILEGEKTRIARPVRITELAPGQTIKLPFVVGETVAACESFRVLGCNVAHETALVQYAADGQVEIRRPFSNEEDPKCEKFLRFWKAESDWWLEKGYSTDEDGRWIWDSPLSQPEKPWQKAIEMPASFSRCYLSIQDCDTRFVTAYSERECAEEGVECLRKPEILDGLVLAPGEWKNYGRRRTLAPATFDNEWASFASLWRSKQRYPRLTTNPLCFTTSFSATKTTFAK